MDIDITGNLAKINELIKLCGVHWDAFVSPLTQLSSIEVSQRLGLIYDEEEYMRILKTVEERLSQRKQGKLIKKMACGQMQSGIASEWDWRNISGHDWTTPVKNQGCCGSSVAFAIIGALEILIKRWIYNDPSLQSTVDYSEAHLFFYNHRQCTLGDIRYGWWVSSALDCLKARGVPEESCYPYVDTNQEFVPCPDWEKYVGFSKIKNWESIYCVDDMKKYLNIYGALVADFVVYDDFLYYYSGVYEHVWGQALGGHAVTVVGYSDVDECWICRNSWGQTWGENGYFKIAYGECGIDDIMYKMDLVSPIEEAASILGVRKRELDELRQFRDKVIQTRKGKAYLARVERNIGQVVLLLDLLKRDAGLRRELASSLRSFIKALSRIDTERVIIFKPANIRAVERVVNKIALAEPRLESSIRRIRRDLLLLSDRDLLSIMREL